MWTLCAGAVSKCVKGAHGVRSFDTFTLGGNYGPRNVVAVWVEDAEGAFVKTLGRWSNRRTQHLANWIAASGQNADAVSGATRSNHIGRLSASWDLLDGQGNLIPPGTYSIKVEICEDNTRTAIAWYGCFWPPLSCFSAGSVEPRRLQACFRCTRPFSQSPRATGLAGAGAAEGLLAAI